VKETPKRKIKVTSSQTEIFKYPRISWNRVVSGDSGTPPDTIAISAAEAVISKNYCAVISGSPEVEPRFCPWLILFKY
jgi:hypothetical protein